MGKSKSRSGSEVEFLRGQIRSLKKELKYYKKREHLFDAPTEEIEEVQEVEADECPSCRRGILIIYDFKFASLAKCSNCEYEKRSKKRN